MTEETRQWLYTAARTQQTTTDPAHDFEHVKRVVSAGLRIARAEGADPDIVEAAGLFHDIVMYRKGTEQNKNATEESADMASRLLNYTDFPKEKRPAVYTCIRECSFSKGLKPSSIESACLFDADMLDACGALGIMRTFCYGGMTNRIMYTPDDPFCRKGGPVVMRSGVDHFYDRLLLIYGRMNTETGRKIAERRTIFLHQFLAELELELEEIK